MSRHSDSKTYRHIYVVYRRVQLADLRMVWCLDWMGPKVQHAREHVNRKMGKFKIVKYGKEKA